MCVSAALDAVASLINSFSSSLSDRVTSLKTDWEWDPNVIRRNIEKETITLSQRSEPALKAELRRHLFQVAKIEQGADDAALARGVVLRAAESLKVPNAKLYPNPADLENAVLEAWMQQLLKQLQKLSLTRPDELEEQLRNELSKLSEAHRDAIGKTLQVERVTAEAVMSVLKTGGSTLAAQALVGSFGFGAFLFLATTLKAVGLLFGTSFAFGTYAAASSSLAFLLSPPFLLLVVVLTGGVVLGQTWSQLDGYKAQLLVVIGRSQSLTSSGKRTNAGWFRRALQWLSMIWRKIWTWTTAKKARCLQGATSGQHR